MKLTRILAAAPLAFVLAGSIALANAPKAAAPAAPTAAAAARELQVASGSVKFLATTLKSIIKVNGVGKAPTGKLSIKDGKASGEFTFELASLDTDMDRRNKHMREALETEKFPTAKVTFADVEVAGDTVEKTIPAQLTLHGETKPIQMKSVFKKNGDTYMATGEFAVELTNFGITPPTQMGMTVHNNVAINIDTVLKQ